MPGEHAQTRIDLTYEIDRWQYTCPHGHTIGNIDAATETYNCTRCGRTHGIDTTTWTYIIDRRSGEEISFERVRVDAE